MSTGKSIKNQLVCLEIEAKIVSSHTPDSKQVKQEVNSTMILPLDRVKYSDSDGWINDAARIEFAT